MSKRWEVTAVTLRLAGEELPSERVGGRHNVHWQCAFCGVLHGPQKRGEHCDGCEAEAVYVEEGRV